MSRPTWLPETIWGVLTPKAPYRDEESLKAMVKILQKRQELQGTINNNAAIYGDRRKRPKNFSLRLGGRAHSMMHVSLHFLLESEKWKVDKCYSFV